MSEEKPSAAKNLVDETPEKLVPCSELLLATVAAWRWIALLSVFAVALSLIWHTLRPPIYEAKAAIRIGWVRHGVNIMALEPVNDLVITVKQASFVRTLLVENGIATQGELDAFVARLSVKSHPKTNVVEFTIVSREQENARFMLEKLISKKLAEHDKIFNDFQDAYEENSSDSVKGYSIDGRNEGVIVADQLLKQQSVSVQSVPPLFARTVVSQPVYVAVKAIFPSLGFLIVASLMFGLIFGTLLSFILKNVGLLKKIFTV